MSTYAAPTGYAQPAKRRVLALPNGGEHPIGPPETDGIYVNGHFGPASVMAITPIAGSYLGSYAVTSTVGTQTGTVTDGADATQVTRSRRRAEPVVADFPGCDLRPDPLLEPANPAGLIHALNDYRAWAGDVSYRAMADQCGQLASASSLQRTLTGRKLPTMKQVRAVILGCGGTDEDVRRFATAWRRIRSPHQAAKPRPVKLVRIGLPDTKAG